METTAGAVFIVLSVLFAANPTAAAPPPLPPNSCADEILLVSPCLPYISQPPNDLDVNVTAKCCQVFSSVVAAGSGACLCYLIRDPAMLGFLLNTTRLLSLSSVCAPKQSNPGNESLASICSAPSPLPPLQGTGDSINQHPSVSTASPARSPRLAPSSIPPPHAASIPEAPKAADDGENGPLEKPPTLQWFINSAAAATRYCLIPCLVHNLLLIVLSAL